MRSLCQTLCFISLCALILNFVLVGCAGPTPPPSSGRAIAERPSRDVDFTPPPNQVWVSFCLDPFRNGGIRAHLERAATHDRADRPNEETWIYVNGRAVGAVYDTEKDAARSEENLKLYETAAEMAKKKGALLEVSLVMVADSETLYEHIIGVLNAAKRRGIGNIVYMGNPRLEWLSAPK